MSIPFSNTTVTITRVPQTDMTDGYDPDPPGPARVAEKVRAVVSLPSANPVLVGGDRITYSSRLTCDPVDLQANDLVTDDTEGTSWVCLWARQSGGFGLDHTVAALRLVTGAS